MFETDVAVARGKVKETEATGERLVTEGNYQSKNISQRLSGLRKKLSDLETATATRRTKLNASSEYLQFSWKADLVDSWISTLSFDVLLLLIDVVYHPV